jgi:hypothetical protein
VRFADLAAIELAGLRFQTIGKVVDEDFPVDLGSVHGGAAFEQQLRLFRLALLICRWIAIRCLRRRSISPGESFFSRA